MIGKLRLLWHHPGFIKYFKNTSWLFAERILRVFVGFFVGIWVARYLGPESFGLFSYAVSFVGLFSAVATLGLDGIVVRELVKRESDHDALIGTAFWMKLWGAAVVLVLLAAAIFFTHNGVYTNTLVFIIASAAVFQSFNVINFYFQAAVLSKYFVYSNVISLAGSSILKIVLILSDAPLTAFAVVVALDAFFLAVSLIYFYMKLGYSPRKWRFDSREAKNLFKDSWPMILSGVAISFYMRIDQVMIANILGNEQTGFYAAAVRLSEIWLFITGAISSSLSPAIVRAKKTSQELYVSRIQQLYRLLVAIALAISVLVVLLAGPIVHYTYGTAFEEAVPLLRWYVWSIVFVYLNNGAWQWYLNENLQRYAMVRLLAGAAVNIALNLIWIETYGSIGAVYATLISYAIATYFGNLLSKKTYANFKMQTIALLTFYKLKGKIY